MKQGGSKGRDGVGRRYAAKVDGNHREIVDALRKQGAFVVSTASMGGGFPDLYVSYRGWDCILECKVKGGKLTPDQEQFWADYYGAGGKRLFVVQSESEALKTVLGGWLESQRRDRMVSNLPLDSSDAAKPSGDGGEQLKPPRGGILR